MGTVDARREAERFERLRRAVLAFFADFSAGRFEAARAKTTEDFAWFGKRIGAAEWAGEKLARFVADSAIAAKKAREVPTEIVERWLRASAADLFDGALAEDDAVVLVDVDRQGATSTCGVIATSDGRVRRVFDPEALQVALRRVGSN